MKVHSMRHSLATHYHAGTQVSGEIFHYHYMCPLEAQRKTKSGSVLPLKTSNFLEITTMLQKIPPNSSTQTNLGRYMCAHLSQVPHGA